MKLALTYRSFVFGPAIVAACLALAQTGCRPAARAGATSDHEELANVNSAANDHKTSTSGSVSTVAVSATQTAGASPAAKGSYVVQSIGPFLRSEGDEVSHEFQVMNETKETIVFVEKRPSCGCATAEIDRMTLDPGESCGLRLSARSDVFRSMMHGISCKLITESGAVWEYGFSTRVFSDAAFEPASVSFGRLLIGKGAEKSGKLVLYTREGQEPLRPGKEELSSTEIAFRLSSHLTTADHTDGLVRSEIPFVVSLPPRERNGVASATARIACSSPSLTCDAKLELHWDVATSFIVKPPRCFFGRVAKAAKRPTMTISISRDDGEPFTVRAITCRNALVSAEAILGHRATEHTVTVTIDPVNIRRALYAELEILTDFAAEPKLRIPVSAIAG